MCQGSSLSLADPFSPFLSKKAFAYKSLGQKILLILIAYFPNYEEFYLRPILSICVEQRI
jgi:hypothetical protein